MLTALFRAFSFKPKQVPFKKWNITRGDHVHIISGHEKGKHGRVVCVLKKRNQVIVHGVNLRIRHKRAGVMSSESTTTYEKESPIHVSNMLLSDPETKKPTRVKIGYLEDGTRVRVSKKSGAVIPKPKRNNLTYERRHKKKIDGVKDTKTEIALKRTYFGEDFEKIKEEFNEYIKKREKEAMWLVFPE
ncbi:unnamed protein product [Blepharisma stoltei]|uniref:Large ribosomal subunit protein uL24 C-terminal domain-containing protein n=1 Tax=Blepharisma stoltei TaxID=1481888 RepID=A0AAU9J5B1_9CILI|nr:unnamed protein product [Blepharisma stoltei]